ncbi:hypothetical protein B0H10DRAFT_2201676 [Mycena sp. CBHHK59/15]|nr:hypothetical protein B0H10DRAFT_2201676 [Mycena sp. CBHHK59/15]
MSGLAYLGEKRFPALEHASNGPKLTRDPGSYRTVNPKMEVTYEAAYEVAIGLSVGSCLLVWRDWSGTARAYPSADKLHTRCYCDLRESIFSLVAEVFFGPRGEIRPGAHEESLCTTVGQPSRSSFPSNDMSALNSRRQEIAIVGVAAQLPSGDFSPDDLDFRTFWDFLIEKGQAYQPLNPDLFNSSEFGALQDTLNLPAKAAFLKNYDGLDAVAFGIGAKDARVMPFTARRLMELSFDALSDSGVDYRRKKVGCFMSGTSKFEVGGPVNSNGSFASIPSALPNRISYMLDITGPSVQVDTACSSSLTGLHLAIQAIEAGDCTTALVGAAQINREIAEWKNYSVCGVLSSDGITKPFDAKADGFGRGEGAVVVVLKQLEDALRDNDHIYSVVLGSAINSTGARMPLNVPSAVAQKECIQMAYARAGKNPSDADYVELHITGTSVGDRIEANAAGEVFARGEALPVGTVKGNVGHLEAAAFLISLLKACLILEKKIVPPTVNLSFPSPAITWAQYCLHVPTEVIPLGCCSSSGDSIISLAGGGIGGSTGHVVIGSPPATSAGADIQLVDDENVPVTFVVGGLSSRAVVHICQSIRANNFSDIQTMRACAVTLSRRARQSPWRTYFTMPIPLRTEIVPPTLVPTSPSRIAFIFSGQGPQNLEMGRGLFAAFPVFRSTILELDEVYRRRVGHSLLETTGLFVSKHSLASPPSLSLSPTAWPVTITVAAIAMLQMALFDLLVSAGIRPAALVDHSAGETAVLYTSGAGSKAMAMEIAIARGEAMTVTESADVGMASFACSEDVAATLISQISVTHGSIEISCFNSPDSVALSGSTDLLGEAIALAQGRGICAQRIRTMVPGHSAFMNQIKADYMTRMREIFARYPGPHTPTVPVFSTCTDLTLVREFSSSYFWDNCRNPVRFSPAVSNLLDFHANVDSNPLIFLEISCHAVLSSLIYPHRVSEQSVLCPMRRPSAKSPEEAASAEPTVFTETLARIIVLGYNSCDLGGLYGTSVYKPSFIKHPWVFRTIASPNTHFSDVRSTNQINQSLSTNISMNELTQPLLAQHVINGEPIVPATGFLEIVLQAGATILWDVEFVSIFSLSARNSARMILERSGSNWTLKSMDPGPAATGREHARGLMDFTPPPTPAKFVDLQSTWNRLPKLEIKGFYQSLQPFATFGPAYRKVVRCHGGPSEVIAEVQAPALDELCNDNMLHPPTLDACLHVMLHPEISKQFGHDNMYLPSKIGRFTYHKPGLASGNWFSHIHRQTWSPDFKSYNVVVMDGSGALICEFIDLHVRRLPVSPSSIPRRLDLIFQPISIPTDISGPKSGTYSYREHDTDEDALFKALDSLALRMISKSLQDKSIAVGDDLSRRRYLEFSQKALQRAGPSLPDISDDREVRRKYPAHFEVTARIAYIHRSVFQSSKYIIILTLRQLAVDSLYSDDLMARFYSRSGHANTVYPEASKTFSTLLESLQQGGKRAINILEVGAGTGLLTKYLVEELQRNPNLLADYTVTDTSYALAAELARSIGYHKITPKVYDLTKPTRDQGLLPESYDVIVALHVLHVVPDMRSCLSALKELLVPGGSMLVIELDGTSWGEKFGSVWWDCVFGSFSEWFGFTDGRTHCTMSPTSWLEELHDLGFVKNHASVEDGGHNFLFTAQKPSSSSTLAIHNSDVPPIPRHLLEYSFGNEIQLQTRLTELSPKEQIEVYLVALHGRDGDAAMGLGLSLIPEFPFWQIRLAIFESAAHLLDAAHFISKNQLLYNRGENTVYFPCKGSPCVPRVVIAPPPKTVAHDYPRLDHADRLLVEITTFEPTSVSLCGFLGRVVMSHRETIPPAPSLWELRTRTKHPSSILLQRLGPIQVVVATSDENMAGAITTYFEAIDSVSLVQCDFRTSDVSKRVDAVVSDSPTLTQYPHIRRWIPRAGRLLLWDTMLQDNIRDCTWEIAHALDIVIPELQMAIISQHLPHPNALASKDNSHFPLFRHNKAYVLLGGIGGLGVDLAVWMYQHGARHITLTSRRGINSLDPQTDDDALSKIAYLRACDDLTLRLERCDATSPHATSVLIKSIHVPIAGCFQMTLVLKDALFLHQTQSNFAAVHDSKIKVFEVFSAEVDISTLDFYVAFSSLGGLLGHAGQSSYTSACTVLDGILAHYHNAFSLIVPGILGAGFLDRTDSTYVDKSDAGILSVAISAAQLWACLQDGLQKLRDGSPPFAQYIPDLDWTSIHARYPLPFALHHLLSSEQNSVAANAAELKSEDDILKIVLSFVEVGKEDFDFERPLLSYGLDSLSATRLSSALQPFVKVSQVELLVGISWSELRTRLQAQSLDPDRSPNTHPFAQEILLELLGVNEIDFDPNIPLVSYGIDPLSAEKIAIALRPHLVLTPLQLLSRSTWAELLASTDVPNGDDESSPFEKTAAIVEICSGTGIPLIIFPGTTGEIASLLPLGPHFSGTLWGVQLTESSPVTPLTAHAAFVVEEIRRKRPNGPYRLAAFSGSSIIGVAVAKLLEASDEQVVQLAFIDGFPLLWTNEAKELLLRQQDLPAGVEHAVADMINLIRDDPLYGPASEPVRRYEAVLAGSLHAAETDLATLAAVRRIAGAVAQFLADFYPQNAERSYSAFAEALTSWVSLPAASQTLWADLGAHRCSKPVQQHLITGVGHLGMFADKRTAAFLQEY